MSTSLPLENRYTPIRELRSEQAASGQRVISGIAAPFNVLTNIGSWYERILPGAFSESIKSLADVRLLVDHNPSLILARTKSRTLHLEEQSSGLYFRATLGNTTAAHDLAESLKRGDVDGCSFAFTIPKGGDRWNNERLPGQKYSTQTRELLSVDLHDVSVVTFPAYPQTSVSIRSLFPALGHVPPDILARVAELRRMDEEEIAAVGVHDEQYRRARLILSKL